ncbi:VanW family protein [Pseudokineococcus sp. 5B2Z-1]|uniref:VanW family protein n=1 Tax=Pseudokineococcus sp. 5B2Z-1 TaxID=3132744 RepID=UPI0030AD0716
MPEADHGADQPTADTARTTAGEPAGTARRRRWPWVVGGVAVLVVGGYGSAAALTADRVPSGTTVLGVPVGGLDREEAAAVLQGELVPRAEEPVPVRAGSATAEVVPADAGLGLDAGATLDDLTGFSLDPRALWRHVVDRGEEVEPVVVVDEDALTASADALVDPTRVPPQEGAVAFDAEGFTTTAATTGSELDAAGAVDLLREQWPGLLAQPAGGDPLELPTRPLEPEVDQAAVDAFTASFAEPAVAGPLPVRVGTAGAELPVASFAPLLAAQPTEEGELAPVVDAGALRAALLEVAPELDASARDASLELQDGRPVVVPAVVGRSVDAEVLAPAALEALAVAPGPERVAVVDAQEVQPERTTADVEALGVTEVISEFSTPLRGSNAGRLQNVGTAARTVSGTLLAPGEVFDLNEVLGRRTAAAGYAEATIISGGRYVESYGGGVSQISTTLYNGAFFAGLELLEHRPHSFYISRYPEGREATLDFATIDMRFRNDTSTGVLIEMSASSSPSGDVTVRFWGTDVSDVSTSTSGRRDITQPTSRELDTDDCIPSTASEGFTVTVTRTVRRGGAVVHDDRDVVRYDPVPGITCA